MEPGSKSIASTAAIAPGCAGSRSFAFRASSLQAPDADHRSQGHHLARRRVAPRRPVLGSLLRDRRQGPGPSRALGDESGKLTQASVPPPIVGPARPTLESLRCNRGVQWSRVTDVEPEQSHDVMIVPGAVRAGARSFQPPHPRDADADAAAQHRRRSTGGSGRAAATSSSRRSPTTSRFRATWLTREMAERMSDSNLVLLHPCLRARYVDAAAHQLLHRVAAGAACRGQAAHEPEVRPAGRMAGRAKAGLPPC